MALRALRRGERGGHSSWADVAIGLTQPTRTVGRKQPRGLPLNRPYSVLLPVGFAVPLLLPVARWALTPPFHPCRRKTRGGLLSVALSLGSPPPAINRHRVSMEPGLSSPAAFRLLLVRPPGRLAERIKAFVSRNAICRGQELFRRRRQVPPGDASPSCNSPATRGSCVWRHGRHCT
jgi:hypothetical protein